MSEIKLKPCPFCGGEAELTLFLGNYLVCCTECLGSIFPTRGMTREEAIAHWNTRKPMERIVEKLEEENKRSLNEMYRLHGNNYETVLLKKHNDSICEIVKGEGGDR